MSKTSAMKTKNDAELKVPTDLRKALSANQKILELWNDITPIGRRDFVGWVESARHSETRKRRIDVTISKLRSGKKRPCCYAIVPMNLYKALADRPKAKAVWSTLTPDERRDFVSWIDKIKDGETRSDRVDKACIMLTSGKKHP